jgi:hypothetical protein
MDISFIRTKEVHKRVIYWGSLALCREEYNKFREHKIEWERRVIWVNDNMQSSTLEDSPLLDPIIIIRMSMLPRSIVRSIEIANRPIIRILFLMQALSHWRSHGTICLLTTPIRPLKHQNVLRMPLVPRPPHAWTQISECVWVESCSERNPAFLSLQGECYIKGLIDS